MTKEQAAKIAAFVAVSRVMRGQGSKDDQFGIALDPGTGHWRADPAPTSEDCEWLDAHCPGWDGTAKATV